MLTSHVYIIVLFATQFSDAFIAMAKLELRRPIPLQPRSIFGVQQCLLTQRNKPIDFDRWIAPR